MVGALGGTYYTERRIHELRHKGRQKQEQMHMVLQVAMTEMIAYWGKKGITTNNTLSCLVWCV